MKQERFQEINSGSDKVKQNVLIYSEFDDILTEGAKKVESRH